MSEAATRTSAALPPNLNQLVRHDGLVKHMNVVNLRDAIEELVQTRHDHSTQFLTFAVDKVLASARQIIADVEKHLTQFIDGPTQLTRRKIYVDCVLDHLRSTTVDYANIRQVEAAVSHTTAAIAELLEVTKIRPARADRQSEDCDRASFYGSECLPVHSESADICVPRNADGTYHDLIQGYRLCLDELPFC